MQRLLDATREIYDDMVDDGELYPDSTAHYGSIIADQLVQVWTELEDPWKWVSSNGELRAFFEEVFDRNATSYPDVELARGTDFMPFYELKDGDLVDYSKRYTSWTTDRNVALKFVDSKKPILFLYKGQPRAFDLSKVHKDEKEYIVAPQTYRVKKMHTLSKTAKCFVLEDA